MKVYRFPQPNGTTLVMTQRADQPDCFDSRYEDGTTIADRINDIFVSRVVDEEIG
jgi:hypothetical protein